MPSIRNKTGIMTAVYNEQTKIAHSVGKRFSERKETATYAA
ncbi:MAG: hypothetical protein JETT_3304 [Candidatus Jettenia ecosi]|uniref:Uncharacterized protein n=1 Tax=Candidatus Jettenia ecosi TaxID=2494326 RepID=A0A533Q745_9BACT|nr:MAG: hypothetical protein JETT_3304 [Candidatus Jettenia ecosi]